MAASTEVIIGDIGAQHVLIRPLSRSNPGLFDERDGNWIDCEVELAAGGFRGRIRTDVSSEALSLTSDGAGRVRATGEAVDVAGVGNRLQFGFDLNQVLLPDIARALGYLLDAFPTLDAPDE